MPFDRRASLHESDLLSDPLLLDAVTEANEAVALAVPDQSAVPPSSPPEASPAASTPPADEVMVKRSTLDRLLRNFPDRPARRGTSPVERAVNWSVLPPFPDSDELDAWLLAAEAAMAAHNVAERDWACRLLTCPAMPEDVRVSIADGGVSSYPELRRRILQQFGPSDPVGESWCKVFDFKGPDCKSIRLGLGKLLKLHNRACRDAGRPEKTQLDLVQPFIRAFPQRTQVLLRPTVGAAMRDPDPLRYLYDVAIALPKGGDALVVAPVAEPAAPEPTLQETLAELVAALRPAPAKRRRTDPASGQPRGPCVGCGRDCVSRRACPAMNAACNKCGVRGHYAAVCRQTSPAPAPTSAQEPHFQ